MVEERPGTDRLVAFTDAVVAIAITLLVLPLVDEFATPLRAGTGADLWVQLQAHTGQLFAFVLSFALIARQWWWHHQTFRGLRHLSTGIVLLDLGWVFTIVALPLPTVIVAAWKDSTLAFALYAGTLLVSASCLASVVWIEFTAVRGSGEGHRRARRNLVASATTVTVFAAVLVVGLTVTPGWGYFCYFLLVLTGPVEAVIDRRSGARQARADAAGPV